MKKLALALLLLVAPASATITMVQHPANTSCGTSVSTCAVTMTATGVGHALLVMAQFQDTATAISSVSGGAGFVVCSNCHATDATAVRGIDAAYATYATSSVTTVTVTFSATCTAAQVEVVEYSYTGDALAFDVSGNAVRAAATSISGVGLSLNTVPSSSFSNHVIIQGISSGGTVSAVTTYTNPADFSTNAGTAGLINTTSGTAPTWTTTSARAVVAAMAFREVPVPQRPISTMEQVPTPMQSAGNVVIATSDTLAYPFPVRNGNTLVVAWHTNRGVTPSPTIADTQNISWTQVSCTVSRANFYFYVWIGATSYTGDDIVTVTDTSSNTQTLFVSEFSNLSTTVDVCATANNDFASNSATVPSITTTKYRDLLLDFVVTNSSNQTLSNSVGSSYALLFNGAGTTVQGAQYRIMGNPGTESGVTMTIGNNVNASELALAIKSTASLAVSTTAVPDAIKSQSYNFQLGATGGDGTNTWTITSGALPIGLNLSSGGNINGTCTNSNSNTITFKVTDTNSHTATKNLTVTCAKSANTIALVQSTTASACGTPNVAPASNVTAGDLLIVAIGGGGGFSNSHVVDKLGTVFNPLPQGTYAIVFPNGGGGSAGQVQLFWGFAPSTGSDSGSWQCFPAQTTSTSFAEFSHVQQIFDTGVLSLTYSTAGGSSVTSNAITSPVTETLYSSATIGTGTGTVTPNSPFSNITLNSNGGRKVSADYEIGAASGSETVSYTIGSNTSNEWSIILFGLRPDATGLAPRQHNRARVY
jgi:Putative Ig domain